MSDLIERLRKAHEGSSQRALGSDIFLVAADRIEELEAENERLYQELADKFAVRNTGDDGE